jgi:hypothetical protein
MNLVGHAVEIECWVTYVVIDDLRHPSSNPVHGFVGQVFRAGAAPTAQNGYELAANLLVFPSGLLAIRVEPGQQPVECLRG